MSGLELKYNFASLSVRDLLMARDLYHYHLLSRANVVGTAIGLYLIRKDEAWPTKKGEGAAPSVKKTYPRTLFNSEVRDYSWPCILAFVRKWENHGAGVRNSTLDGMWNELGDRTADVMAQGALYLAVLWQSAWEAGNGAAVPSARLVALVPADIRARYIDDQFVPSLTLNEIGNVLR
jgi:hypothetical protein